MIGSFLEFFFFLSISLFFYLMIQDGLLSLSIDLSLPKNDTPKVSIVFSRFNHYLSIQEMNLHRTLGTAAWNTKSVIGKASEFVAVTIIDTTFDGLPGDFSNAKSIFKPLL